jgi:ribose transport system ATP-binding protein
MEHGAGGIHWMGVVSLDQSYVVEMKGIRKEFPGVVALDNVGFNLRKGEVHALVGENGAGKSTLIKILAGAHQADHGDVYVNGQKVNILSPRHAQELGISVIYQEFNLIPYLSVAENIFLGRESMSGRYFINNRDNRARAREVLDRLELDVDVDETVAELGVAQRQMVEVAKALSMQANIIVMDEPTSALGNREIEQLFKTIEKMKAQGISVIYISHRLEELWQIADRVTVLRDGQYIATTDIDKLDKEQLIKQMVGRDLTEQFPERNVRIGEEMLRVENLSKAGVLKDVSFRVRRGEVVGFAGLVGSGRTELMRCLFGADRFDTGKIYLNNQEVQIKSPRDAIGHGIGFITEDRQGQGLMLVRPVKENITITALDQVIKKLFIDYEEETNVAGDMVERLRIRTPGLEQEVRYLSGGNQQKVVIAKWLLEKARILIFDEPTRGIDVGAKKEVYSLINELVGQGVGVIMVSSELPEVLGMSDRIYVMSAGRITGELSAQEATQERILEYATKE